jgi:hypothetical protein
VWFIVAKVLRLFIAILVSLPSRRLMFVPSLLNRVDVKKGAFLEALSLKILTRYS